MIKLDIGCGPTVEDGWLGVDPMDLVDRPFNIVQRAAWDLPSEDGTVGEIRCLHAFEHFEPSRHATILMEWRRVLCRGGLLTIVVPDARYVLQYLIDHPGEPWAWDMVFGRGHYPGDEHRTAWDATTLGALLSMAGFMDVRTSYISDPDHKQSALEAAAVAP